MFCDTRLSFDTPYPLTPYISDIFRCQFYCFFLGCFVISRFRKLKISIDTSCFRVTDTLYIISILVFVFQYSVFKVQYEQFLTLFNGDGGNRTLDPLLARQVLSQLSYTPILQSHLYATVNLLNVIRQPPALPYRLQYSTIGRLSLNRRVRDGYGCFP